MDVLLNIALEALDLAIEKSGNKVLMHAYKLIREEKKCLSKAKQIHTSN